MKTSQIIANRLKAAATTKDPVYTLHAIAWAPVQPRNEQIFATSDPLALAQRYLVESRYDTECSAVEMRCDGVAVFPL
jgi:hypothetical protein